MTKISDWERGSYGWIICYRVKHEHRSFGLYFGGDASASAFAPRTEDFFLSVVGGGTGAAYLSGFAKSPLWDLAGGGIILGSSAYAQRSFL